MKEAIKISAVIAAALLLTAAVPTDDSLTLSDLSLTWRDPRESIVESFA